MRLPFSIVLPIFFSYVVLLFFISKLPVYTFWSCFFRYCLNCLGFSLSINAQTDSEGFTSLLLFSSLNNLGFWLSTESYTDAEGFTSLHYFQKYYLIKEKCLLKCFPGLSKSVQFIRKWLDTIYLICIGEKAVGPFELWT